MRNKKPDHQDQTACRKKPRAQSCSVTLPLQLQQAVVNKARQEDRSFSSVIRQALAIYVERN